jgi:hypothetical protein
MLIAHATSEVLFAVCECSLNLLKGVIPLTPRQKRMLSRYKTHLRALTNKKVSKKRKKRYLTQKGGCLLTTVLPPVINVLGICWYNEKSKTNDFGS